MSPNVLHIFTPTVCYLHSLHDMSKKDGRFIIYIFREAYNIKRNIFFIIIWINIVHLHLCVSLRCQSGKILF